MKKSLDNGLGFIDNQKCSICYTKDRNNGGLADCYVCGATIHICCASIIDDKYYCNNCSHTKKANKNNNIGEKK